MTSEEIDKVGAFLDAFSTMTLATQGPAGPWAAPLFYAHDKALNIYFLSSEKSRHIKDLLSEPNVAVTVNGLHDRWTDICGLQMAGTAGLIADDRRGEVADLYLQKFPEIRRILSTQSSDAERKIAKGFTQSNFYCIRLSTIRLIDNKKSFGHKDEFVLSAI